MLDLSPSQSPPLAAPVSAAHLLAPLSLPEFLARHWGREHLVLHRADPAHYRGLFSFEDVDRYLALAGRDPAAQAAVGQAGAPPRSLRLQGLDARELYGQFQAGATILLEAIERFWPAAAELAADLGEALGARVKVNVYLTPPGSQGAPIHPDVQDVFVLQLEGAKDWYVYDAAAFEPVPTLAFAPHVGRRAPGYEREPPLAERTLLERGDLLYLPRGRVHRAVAPAATPSLHWAVCVTPVYWVDVLKAAVELASADHPELARPLPPHFERDPALREALRPLFAEALRLVAEHASLDRTADLFAQAARACSRAYPADGHFGQLVRLGEIAADTVMERRRGLLPRLSDASSSLDAGVELASARVEEAGGVITLRFGTAELRLAPAFRAALELICDRRRFRVAELPGLSAGDRLALVRRLVRDGLLRAELPPPDLDLVPGPEDR